MKPTGIINTRNLGSCYKAKDTNFISHFHIIIRGERLRMARSQKLDVLNNILNTDDSFKVLNSSSCKITSIDQIGTGNINYIYRIQTSDNTSFIIKLAELHSRISNDIILSTNRNYYEAVIISIYQNINRNFVPTLFSINKFQNYFVMEDLKDYKDLKSMMNQNIIPIQFLNNLIEYFTNIFAATQDLNYYLFDRKDIASYNKDLRCLTNKLVFSDPYIRNSSNIHMEENTNFIEMELYNAEIKERVLQAKHLFNHQNTTLIHGDLHTGSILISGDGSQMKIIDFEFAMPGPLSYDTGNLLAHFTIFLIKEYYFKNNAKLELWLEKVIDSIIKLIQKHAYLDNDYLLDGTALFCGAELIRRIIGIAKFTELKDISKNDLIIIEKITIVIGKRLLLESQLFQKNVVYMNFIRNIVQEYK